jgi:hypothetical protein
MMLLTMSYVNYIIDFSYLDDFSITFCKRLLFYELIMPEVILRAMVYPLQMAILHYN